MATQATESDGDFVLFREALTELECLVQWQTGGNFRGLSTKTIREGIIYTLELLTKFEVNTSVSNAIEELERLGNIQLEVARYHGLLFPGFHGLDNGEVFDGMIESKIDFIKSVSFSRRVSEDGVEPMAAIERLAARTTQSDTSSCNEVATASGHASQTRVCPKGDLPNECEECKTKEKFVSSPLSWLFRDQDNVHAKDDDSSTVDGGQLTPTSTVVSELPDPNGG